MAIASTVLCARALPSLCKVVFPASPACWLLLVECGRADNHLTERSFAPQENSRRTYCAHHDSQAPDEPHLKFAPFQYTSTPNPVPPASSLPTQWFTNGYQRLISSGLSRNCETVACIRAIAIALGVVRSPVVAMTHASLVWCATQWC